MSIKHHGIHVYSKDKANISEFDEFAVAAFITNILGFKIKT